MTKRYFIILAALLGIFTSVAAQEEKKEQKEAFRTNNWYLEVGAGPQLFFGSDASMLGFGKRITPAVSFTAGRWVSPFWGVRFQAVGYALNGFSTAQGLFVGDKSSATIYGPNDPVRDFVSIRPDGSYRYYLRYMNLHMDFQLSLANLFGGYNPHRAWDIIPAVGIGYMQTFAYKGTPDVSSISTNFSLMGKWKLPEGFDLNLELFYSLMPDRFDGRITETDYESLLGLSLGLTYNFKGKQHKAAEKGGRNVAAKPHDTDWLADVRQVVRDEIAASKIVRHTDTVTIVKEVVREVVKEVEKDGAETRDNAKAEPTAEKTLAAKANVSTLRIASLRFESGRAVPLQHQEVQLANIAEFAKANPTARFVIEGYADGDTGSEEYNMLLSEKRAVAVRDLLVNDYGLSADILETKAFGSGVQVYSTSNWNRVVIVKAYFK